MTPRKSALGAGGRVPTNIRSGFPRPIIVSLRKGGRAQPLVTLRAEGDGTIKTNTQTPQAKADGTLHKN